MFYFSLICSPGFLSFSCLVRSLIRRCYDDDRSPFLKLTSQMNALIHASFGVSDFWTFLLGTIFIVLLPGPNSLYVLSVAAQRGVRAGYRGACGIFVGDLVLMVLSAGGMAALLKSNAGLFYAVKYVGAAYLGWIGLQMLLHCLKMLKTRQVVVAAKELPVQAGDPFAKALIISLMNPKAILFFISFFIQFVDPEFHAPLLSYYLLGLICQLSSFTYLTLIIFAGARLAESFRQRRRLSAAMSGGVGAMFIGFGLKLATATL